MAPLLIGDSFSLREKARMRGKYIHVLNSPHPNPLPEGEGIFRGAKNGDGTEWYLLKATQVKNYVMPAKAGIQNWPIGRYYSNPGFRLAPETAPAFPVLPPSMAVALA
jgi:hypothetical protein